MPLREAARDRGHGHDRTREALDRVERRRRGNADHLSVSMMERGCHGRRRREVGSSVSINSSLGATAGHAAAAAST